MRWRDALSSQAQQLPTWLKWLAIKGGVGSKRNQGLWVPLSTMSTCALQTVLSDPIVVIGPLDSYQPTEDTTAQLHPDRWWIL
ncbi:hypothetical protein BKA70DRAFT_1437919 [Coprinopsis sp. MPI-PUGE-AT-0042]|nr:hypothetical protein BKA70DRAFT_1437919 [Coprinopsis sp. MPI-PUGE-AT-0042]